MAPYLANAGYLALLALGFALLSSGMNWVISGAKWPVKVEQFAVGFMQAIVSWRKGWLPVWQAARRSFARSLRIGLTDTAARQADAPQKKIHGNAADGWADGDLALAAAQTKLGETEYRLNWLPLGGYVKMLGQDDLKPNSEADDPAPTTASRLASE